MDFRLIQKIFVLHKWNYTGSQDLKFNDKRQSNFGKQVQQKEVNINSVNSLNKINFIL